MEILLDIFNEHFKGCSVNLLSIILEYYVLMFKINEQVNVVTWLTHNRLALGHSDGIVSIVDLMNKKATKTHKFKITYSKELNPILGICQVDDDTIICNVNYNNSGYFFKWNFKKNIQIMLKCRNICNKDSLMLLKNNTIGFTIKCRYVGDAFKTFNYETNEEKQLVEEPNRIFYSLFHNNEVLLGLDNVIAVLNNNEIPLDISKYIKKITGMFTLDCNKIAIIDCDKFINIFNVTTNEHVIKINPQKRKILSVVSYNKHIIVLVNYEIMIFNATSRNLIKNIKCDVDEKITGFVCLKKLNNNMCVLIDNLSNAYILIIYI